jgi:hypothetical protein
MFTASYRFGINTILHTKYYFRQLLLHIKTCQPRKKLSFLLKMPAKQKHHTIRFEMLLTAQQNDHWQALAESNSISKAELVRRRMSGCRIKTTPQINWKCYWQLLKISQDINQIAKTQNLALSQGLIPPQIEQIPFEELQTEISQLRLHLLLGRDEATKKELENSDDWQD